MLTRDLFAVANLLVKELNAELDVTTRCHVPYSQRCRCDQRQSVRRWLQLRFDIDSTAIFDRAATARRPTTSDVV